MYFNSKNLFYCTSQLKMCVSVWSIWSSCLLYHSCIKTMWSRKKQMEMKKIKSNCISLVPLGCVSVCVSELPAGTVKRKWVRCIKWLNIVFCKVLELVFGNSGGQYWRPHLTLFFIQEGPHVWSCPIIFHLDIHDHLPDWMCGIQWKTWCSYVFGTEEHQRTWCQIEGNEASLAVCCFIHS